MRLVFLDLLSACRCMGPGCVCVCVELGGGSRVSACSLMGGIGFSGLCNRDPEGPKACFGLLVGVAGVQGIPGLVPAHWCVGSGPGSSGGQGWIQGFLGAQRVLR